MKRAGVGAEATHVRSTGANQTRTPENNGDKATVAEPLSDLRVILATLQGMRDGDFTVRLPGAWTGLPGKIADTFNQIAAATQQMANDLMRVGEAVGKDGQVREPARFPKLKGSWDEMADSIHTLLEDLLRPATEVTRTIAQEAPGNLTQCAVADVSGREKIEDLLREPAALLDLATEAIVVRDLGGKILFWNSGAENLYGWRREEVLGRILQQVVETRFPVPFQQIDSMILAAGRWQGNLVQHTRDGREITVNSRKALNTDGSHRVVLEVNRDITAQLQTEEALRRTERLAAIGRIAGIIAHEINNPLTAIANAFFLLRNHSSLDSEARYYANLAGEELERISQITRQTLSFCRESQQAVPVSIPAILDDLLQLQSRPLRLQSINIQRRYRTDDQILGFPSELKQVFLNLIGNAQQAMPQGGRLRVSVHRCREAKSQRRGIRVSVSDTGNGIEPEHAKRLFEPFFTTKSVKGTGLGLWISKGIVQKYEGTIQFRSVRVHGVQATCFSVFLPGLGGLWKGSGASGKRLDG
jgi:PAS domain S-box-containing protein